MELKQYQRAVVEQVERFVARVAKQRADGNRRHAALDAWRDLCLGEYRERFNGLGEDLPSFCIKVPTGGGKTLLATQALGSIYRTILTERNGAGLVLWVVPSRQIYRDTLRRLRDRNDMYRLMLEHAVSRRLEIWEKHEIARLSPTRLRDCLNILVLQLASTNRETKEQLKFFKDTGGNIVQHFPPEDDAAAQRRLKERFPNLHAIEDDADAGGCLIATSIGNLVKICRPPVIVDEGHKATSDLARKTIEDFNASIVVELSATPRPGANIVSRVGGQQLLDEEMIKLPLNIATSGQKSWHNVLTQARDKRQALALRAAEYAATAGPDRFIRPIVLVQVQRTGRDQRDAGLIHAEQVKEYLVQRLNVPERAIAIKSSEKDDIEGLDLLDSGCAVEWIITKSALQEGWDCPFAYILVSLNDTASGVSMTQLVGRILRQPYQERTPFAELNESYIYCLHLRSDKIARQVKDALEQEGYEGDLAGKVIDASESTPRPSRTVRIQRQFLELYKPPYEGKIYLPRFCVRGEGKRSKSYEPLDYFRHLVSQVDVTQFPYDTIDWRLSEEVHRAKDRFYRITLGEELHREYETDVDLWERDEQVLAWMVASLRFDVLSHKQLRTLVRHVYERLCRCELSGMVRDRLATVKGVVRDKIEKFTQEEMDRQTEAAFKRLFDAGRLCFYLECAECRFLIPDGITIYPTGRLTRDDGDLPARSLFDFVDRGEVNEYERAVALCLDQDENVLWWYRNLVGQENFSIQSHRRGKVYPDFVVQSGPVERPIHQVIVIESKGEHLEGNRDTEYNRSVAEYFERVGKRVSWQQLGLDFKDHVFRFQILDQQQNHGLNWKDALSDLLHSPAAG